MEYLDQIICGDCLEIMSQIPDNTVHLAVTSPPYNLGLSYDSHDDNLEYEHYLAWLEKVWLETKRVLVPGGRFALNIAPTSIKNFRPIHHDFANQLRKIGLIFRTEILWYKQTMGRRTAWGSWKSAANPHIVPSWEYILVFSKDSWKLAGNREKADITADEFKRFSDGFWYIPPESQRRGHPAPFPEELIYRLTKFYTFKENVVLDMFGGTGTVAVVAYKTGRHFIHIDVSAQYCATAAKRLEVARAAQELPITVSRTGKQVQARFVFRNGNHKEEPKRTTAVVVQHTLTERREKYRTKCGTKKANADNNSR